MKILRPLEDRVIIIPNEALEVTPGGILIPETIQEKPKTGIVFAVGLGRDGKAMVVTEGDEVQYGAYSGTQIESDGQQVLVMRQSDIICIVAPEVKE